jgi:hypothetical protein
MSAVHHDRRTIEPFVEKFLIRFHRKYGRHAACRISNHSIFRNDGVGLDAHRGAQPCGLRLEAAGIIPMRADTSRGTR